VVGDSLVVAMDMGTWDLLGAGGREGPTAQMGGGTIRKSPWLATILEAYGGRLAIEASMEPPVTTAAHSGGERWQRGA
jgi:hypothetical protein